MAGTEEFKNNPLYTDITTLDYDTPAPTFNYNWNKASGRWEPAGDITVENLNVDNLEIDFSDTNDILNRLSSQASGISGSLSTLDDQETHRLLSGISGSLSTLDDQETHRLLSGISGYLSTLDDQETHRLLSGISGSLSTVNDQETHRLLSGISGSLSTVNDQETHRLLSGISGSLSQTSSDQETHRLLSGISGSLLEISSNQSKDFLDLKNTDLILSGISGEIFKGNFTVISKTVHQKIEEDFILQENIPDTQRFGNSQEPSHASSENVFDAIFNTYYSSARNSPGMPETGHPDFFILNETASPDRAVNMQDVFHTDTEYALRFDNKISSRFNSYELQDFTNIYEKGNLQSLVIFNESAFPLQFHTINDPVEQNANENYLYLYSNSAVELSSNEASRIFVKRPHTISGYTVKYILSYKEYKDK
jgi:hypothetical protein